MRRGWRAKAAALRRMSTEDVANFLRSAEDVDARLARWAYRNLAKGGEDHGLRIYALETVASSRAPWARGWLWRELARHKGEPFGDWVVIALTRSGVTSARDATRFARLYEDASAHPDVRGSAVFGVSNAAAAGRSWRDRGRGAPRLDARAWAAIRSTCDAALKDANPYARAGACWLAMGLGGFDEELRRLAIDRTPIHPGGPPVANYAEDALGLEDDEA